MFEDYQNATLNLVVNQGNDFEQTVTITSSTGGPLDLTDTSLTFVIKKYYNSSTSFTGIVDIVVPVAGQISLKIPSTITNLFDSDRYIYKINMTKDVSNVCLLDGQLLIDRF